MTALELGSWWDGPAYKVAATTFPERGALIFSKLKEHDAAKLDDVLSDLYRDAVPDPMDEEISDVQMWKGRVWR